MYSIKEKKPQNFCFWKNDLGQAEFARLSSLAIIEAF